jgi:hypothetical protein
LGPYFLQYYGPIVKAFAAIDAEAREALDADLYALLDKFNVAEDSWFDVLGAMRAVYSSPHNVR